MNNILTISTLQKNGRFGNQLFQYFTGKALARKLGVELQVPSDWIMRKYIEVPEHPISVNLPQYPIDQLPTTGGYDLYGYFQFQEAADLYSRNDCIEWFKPLYYWSLYIEQTLLCTQYHVIHKRRTDYLNNPCYAVITDKSYEDAIKEHDLSGRNFITISDESPSTDPDQFFIDFLHIMHADTIIRANSSYSYWAALLSGHDEVYSPVVEDKTGWSDVKFIKGNWPRCTDCKNHPGHCRVTDINLK